MMKKLLLSIILCVITIPAMAQITGAGATFPYPIYSKWAESFKKDTGVIINYQSIGSGGGIKQIQNKTVTFGATDMPLEADVLDKFGLIQFPLVTGSVVIGHNFKQDNIVLTPDQIANIYLGNLNKLNNENIIPVRRSDASGTTYLFTNWLSALNTAFKDKIGVGSSVSWPIGIGAKGNEGVTNNIKLNNNALGYVEYAYAKQNGLKMINLNINDQVIKPNTESFKNNIWPITSPTYILMHKDTLKSKESKQAIAFFIWVMKNGDKMAEELDYIPLSLEQKNNNLKILE
jgi:phosphate transport system substrate-binding protein